LKSHPYTPILTSRKEERKMRDTAHPFKDTSQQLPLPSANIPLAITWFIGWDPFFQAGSCMYNNNNNNKKKNRGSLKSERWRKRILGDT
jgi:hypothetical protein